MFLIFKVLLKTFKNENRLLNLHDLKKSTKTFEIWLLILK